VPAGQTNDHDLARTVVRHWFRYAYRYATNTVPFSRVPHSHSVVAWHLAVVRRLPRRIAFSRHSGSPRFAYTCTCASLAPPPTVWPATPLPLPHPLFSLFIPHPALPLRAGVTLVDETPRTLQQADVNSGGTTTVSGSNAAPANITVTPFLDCDVLIRRLRSLPVLSVAVSLVVLPLVLP